MKNLRFFYLFLLILFCSSCAKDQWFDAPPKGPGNNNSPYNLICPQIKIAVISDIHYTHPDLLPDNIEDSPSLMEYLYKDRKILELSDPIFRNVVSELIREKPDILLIPGDLAKDGEMMNHHVVQGLLQDLENAGIRVFVVPGNNDIINPDAFSFETEPPTAVDNITADQFAEIYGDFGYNDESLLYRDPNSLSYICQPHSNLWILGIDNIKYTFTTEGLKVSGAIKPETMAWIQEKMVEANEKGIKVMAMMHYGILEHYNGQKGIEPLISGQRAIAEALMDAGIKLIFTGHYHANDIVSYEYNGKPLYDIQTGSLVTPPYSYRIMRLDDNFINIDSRRVTDIDEQLPGGVSFQEYSDTEITARINGFFIYYLPRMFGLSEAAATYFAPYGTSGYKAYFAGDEQIPDEESVKLDALPTAFAPLVNIVRSLWTDLPPKDNKIHIKFK
ncbi:MAG: hypothetical protein GYA71_11675 [Bacteroidales bacterium]|nr:hypothetical protein [Bacteroidales bacterium]